MQRLDPSFAAGVFSVPARGGLRAWLPALGVEPSCIARMFFINNRLGRAQLFAGLNQRISAPGSFFTAMWPGGMSMQRVGHLARPLAKETSICCPWRRAFLPDVSLPGYAVETAVTSPSQYTNGPSGSSHRTFP